MNNPLGSRWYPLKYHAVQSILYRNPVRFPVIPSGRRSGKTELAKRYVVKHGVTQKTEWDVQYYFFGAPTRPQAKRIYWNDLKKMTKKFWSKKPSESELIIWTNFLGIESEFHVLGMDEPARIEGSPWNGGVLDEIANMKPDTWSEHVRPALADRRGFCWLIGVPEGRNHYYEKALYAAGGVIPETRPGVGVFSQGIDKEWAYYHWFSADILPKDEIESAKRELDERTYQQEYEGSFLSYEGILYYTFDRSRNVNDIIAKHEIDKPLYLTCDFNKSPMVWEIGQIIDLLPKPGLKIIDEISIPYNAKTQNAIQKFIERYKNHLNKLIYITGDASGSYESHRDFTTDYIMIRDALKQAGWRIIMNVPEGNPGINNRINVVCSLLKNVSGEVRIFMSSKCRYLIYDLENNEGDNKGGKDKTDPEQTHASDALDYLVWQLFRKEFYKERVSQL